MIFKILVLTLIPYLIKSSILPPSYLNQINKNPFEFEGPKINQISNERDENKVDMNSLILANSKSRIQQFYDSESPPNEEDEESLHIVEDVEDVMNNVAKPKPSRQQKSNSASKICCERLGYPDCNFMVQFPERWSSVFRECIKTETTLNYVQYLKSKVK
ncbi:uncharacterized protein [Onthophagus taurus]|uniref:uncharacterized protein n=1 Tax=Onthophagus taurus TaxID=166361 RepID=UPI0039BDE5DA